MNAVYDLVVFFFIFDISLIVLMLALFIHAACRQMHTRMKLRQNVCVKY